jgi:hypothetical protein
MSTARVWIWCTISGRARLPGNESVRSATGRIRPTGDVADHTCILRTRCTRHTPERVDRARTKLFVTQCDIAALHRKPLTMHGWKTSLVLRFPDGRGIGIVTPLSRIALSQGASGHSPFARKSHYPTLRSHAASLAPRIPLSSRPAVFPGIRGPVSHLPFSPCLW